MSAKLSGIMKNPLLKKVLPHFIAIAVFLIVSLLFCKPAIQGNVLNQHDIVGWKGMSHDAFQYKEKNGHFPLWNPNLFSGMPNYQVAMQGKTVIPDLVKIATLGMPKPINFFFLACICFYILCMVLRTKPVVGIFGGLAYGFATYNAVIIGAGHETKMLAIAFVPLLLAGLIATFEKRYWLGLSLTTIGVFQEIAANHPQISFYFMLVAAAVTISYAITWIKQKDWKHFAMSAGIVMLAGIVGLAGNALTLLTSSEYTPFTMRGGKDVTIVGDSVKAARTSGLDTSYAFQYSLGKAETFVILMPGAFGGGSGKTAGEKSHVVKKLTARGVDPTQAADLAANSLPRYWGGIAPSTSGPPYIGVIVCLLALIGFVILKTPLRWGLLAVTVLGIMMAWGKYLPGFNNFLFHKLPLYNKFRAPSMAMVITQFTLPLVAVLALQFILFREKSRELLKTEFKKILIAFGALFGVMILMYAAMDYNSPLDPLLLNNRWDNSGNTELGRLIVSGLKGDRRSMFGEQLLRSLLFGGFVLGILYMYIRGFIKPLLAGILFFLISSIDLLIVDHEYLNDDNYRSPEEMTSENFTPSANDQVLLADKDPNFRVLNMAADTYQEARTSYFHKSIGGYHPAKLRIYQDVIERYMSNRPEQAIINMLNTKYLFIQNPQTGKEMVIPNPDAFGNCWLVKNVTIVDNAVQSLTMIGKTHLKDTAIVEMEFKDAVVQPQRDSSSSIRMTKFDNDAIEYEANCNGPQFAVFSEVYYPRGWKALLDGKTVPYCKADYVLRGLSIPAGKHSIKFVFEPASVKKGVSIMYIASFIILLFFLGGIYMDWRERKKLRLN
ncbi:MAG TPA: YfhO family protein [Chitinophagaceae bacterium]|nr:YfhO family protein [Chitinophagaceae bacterium]